MRDKRFITIHRGGTLTKENHILLIIWSCSCVEKVLHLLDSKPDFRVVNSIVIAKQWADGKASTGEAMRAARSAHQAAREKSDKVEVAVARAAGHAVATAHMADHALGGALYALKAVSLSGGDVSAEREWQINLLPEQIKELVLETSKLKEKSFRLN
jgi:hypothetical protein